MKDDEVLVPRLVKKYKNIRFIIKTLNELDLHTISNKKLKKIKKKLK